MTKNTFGCQAYFCLRLGCYPLKLNVESKALHSSHLTCDNVHVSIQKKLLFVE
jgi:hypothetical protein